ncbi:hypothetical protein EV360DRAFT_84992 [Lentinula raphanica]|nr:hypothetical protein EV360DRAFT_84992 [Lentinula raphanica]
MLFLSVHSKLAGFGLLMSLLIVLASPLPMDPMEGHKSSPSFPSPSVEGIELMRATTEYDDYVAFGSPKKAVGVVLPGGISPDDIKDPCIRGKLQWLDLEGRKDLEWITVGKVHDVPYAEIEKFVNDEMKKELPPYFQGGNGEQYVDERLFYDFQMRYKATTKMDRGAVIEVLKTVDKHKTARENLYYENHFKLIPTYRRMDPEYDYCAELEAAKTRTVAAAA